MRYEIKTPEWCRVQWASSEARALWEPRLQAINAAWLATERASVGVFRDACLQSVEPAQLPTLSAKVLEQRRELVVLLATGAADSYSASPTPADGGAFAYRVAITTQAAALDFRNAWEDSDNDAMGALLGFPKCCRKFFGRVWVDGRGVDTTAQMAAGESLVAGPVECNIMLRWLGVRWVPHLPCSFSCEPTAELGREFRKLMPAKEAAWIDDLLDGPVQWSARNGIAEIVTPVVKVSAKTDATTEKLVVRRKGTGYPEAGAAGTGFPYLREPGRRQAPTATWADNGFSSLEAMEKAHAVVAGVANAALAELPRPRSVMDFGCGNGALLARLDADTRRGIEIDPARAANAPDGVEIQVGDFTNGAMPTACLDDVQILMPGRLIESGTEFTSNAALVVYGYGDVLAKHGSLGDLCAAAGLVGELANERTGPGVAAGIWRWA